MLLLTARQAEMRRLAAEINDGNFVRSEATKQIRRLLKMEEQSAEGSRATIDRSEHSHVKKSGHAALKNRLETIEHLDDAIANLKARDDEAASVALTAAANCGGKKSVKAARKAPSIALYVQYLTETDEDFQEWLTAQGVAV